MRDLPATFPAGSVARSPAWHKRLRACRSKARILLQGGVLKPTAPRARQAALVLQRHHGSEPPAKYRTSMSWYDKGPGPWQPSRTSVPGVGPSEGSWYWSWQPRQRGNSAANRLSRSLSRGRAALRSMASEDSIDPDLRRSTADVAERIEMQHRKETPLDKRVHEIERAQERHTEALRKTE